MTKVLVTGVFDLLHQEHLTFLKKAKNLGNFLLVAIESDARVRKIKGEGRPINSAAIRQENLKKLNLADQILILPEKFDQPEDHLQFLQSIKPDILAVSSHTAHLSAKQHLMQVIGGKVMVVHQYNPAFSTTQLLKQENHKKQK